MHDWSSSLSCSTNLLNDCTLIVDVMKLNITQSRMDSLLMSQEVVIPLLSLVLPSEIRVTSLPKANETEI